MELNDYYNYLVENRIATEEEIDLVTANEESLDDILHVRTGYRDLQQYTDYEDKDTYNEYFVEELSREELIELKQNYYCNELGNNACYGELGDIDNIVTDEEIFKFSDYVDFLKDDFFCNI